MKNGDVNVIDPWQFARTNDSLNRRLKLSSMTRLAPLLNSQDGSVNFRLAGRVDEQGNALIDGAISAPVELICQRCLTPLTRLLQNDFILAFVRSESEMQRLAPQYDPVIAGDAVQVAELIEDELLLVLPIVPLHEDLKDCSNDGVSDTAALADKAGQTGRTLPADRQKPFEELASLLNDLQKR